MSAAAIGLVAICAFAAAHFALRSTRDIRMRRRLDTHMPPELRPEQRQRRSARAMFEDALAHTENRLEDGGVWRWIDRMRRSAGIRWRNAELIWAVVGACVAVPLVLLVLGASVALAIFALPATLAAAYAVLQAMARRRKRAFAEQLPEMLETLAASLKVGQGLQQSLQVVANETGDPASSEFESLLHELRLGRSLEAALGDLADRMSSPDFHFVVTSIAIQRQVGGSLAELMQAVAETIRRRQHFTRKVEALTAMARISARVLTGLPFAVGIGLTMLNPTYMRPLVLTSTGRLLIAGSMAMLGCGTLVLKRLIVVKG